MSTLRVVVLLSLAAIATVAVRAQAPAAGPRATTGPNDAVAALVVEVRALRTELSQVASASVRSQLLVTRVQLQEQRLMHLDRQRAEVAAKLAEAEKMRATLVDAVEAVRESRQSGFGRATPRHRRRARWQ